MTREKVAKRSEHPRSEDLETKHGVHVFLDELREALAAEASRDPPAMRVLGEVHAKTGDQPLAVTSGNPILGPAWIDVGPEARLQVDVRRSGRELTFVGLSIVEPCMRGEERASLLVTTF